MERVLKILDWIDYAWFTRGLDDHVPAARSTFVILEIKP
jgi:hypothetical protein